MSYPWFFVFVSLVATKLALGPNVIFVLLASFFFGFLAGFPMCFPGLLSWLALLSPLLKQASLDPLRCLAQKRGFILLVLPCQFTQVLFKRVCLACVHSVLFVSSFGPWCQK